jgi:ABC-type transporter Mla subunit MlaD
VAESVRATRQDLAERVGSLTAGAADGGSPELRAQLAEVTRQVAAALGTLAERDQAIVEAVRNRVREHGELVTQETTRISAAMESYVQHGVEAVGQLAGRMDAQLEALTTRDDEISERVRVAVEGQMTLLAEQLQLMYERMAIDSSSVGETIRHHTSRGDERIRAMGEYLHLLNERVDVATRELAAQMQRTLETRVMGLAQLVRSDSEALRGELVRTAATFDERTGTVLDERLAAVSEAVTGQTARMIDELGHRMHDETAQAVRVWIDEALARLESRSEEHARRFDARSEEALGAIDRNMVRMADAIEGQLERLGRTVGDRAAGAADDAIGERFDQVLARLHDATGTVERLPLALQENQERIEQQVQTSVDRRMGALARLVRSDNETLAQQIVTSQEASRQALRSMKELQANLPSEVIEMVEQRFASLAESIERSNEMLSKRIDKMAEKIGDRYDNDIQVVVDRMGDAMHALASLGRSDAAPSPRGAEPRIELD